jgi:hypothetical protein
MKFVSFRARAGLLAAVLAGCAHQSAQSSLAQPFVSSWQHESSPPTQRDAQALKTYQRASLARGQASAPFSWLAEPDARVSHLDASCFAAVRSPQPFGGASAWVESNAPHCHENSSSR